MYSAKIVQSLLRKETRDCVRLAALHVTCDEITEAHSAVMSHLSRIDLEPTWQIFRQQTHEE